MIRAIAAIDNRYGLANEEGIPWDLPSDRAYTREKTMGGSILMGYGTYLEFQKPPAGRTWYVLHGPSHHVSEGFNSVTDLNAFMANPPKNLWIFGGAGVFEQTLDQIDELYLTRIKGDFGCTKFFPRFKDRFELVSQSEPISENGVTFIYEIWKRK